jgi:hypothetical protein
LHQAIHRELIKLPNTITNLPHQSSSGSINTECRIISRGKIEYRSRQISWRSVF